MIFWYSGTGNSRYAAERIARVLGETPVSLNERFRQGESGPAEMGEDLVFVTPTYCWRLPRLVEDWIRRTAFPGAKRAWFVMTCGDEIGNAEKYLRILCRDKGWAYMGAAQIVMPENYLAMFAVPEAEKAAAIIRRAEPDMDAAAACIKAGKPLPPRRIGLLDRLKSGPVNPAFYKLFVKADAFRAGEGCIGCGQCAARCPLGNIRLTAGRPQWGKNCTHCMACIAYCPAGAVEYGKNSVGKPRYHCDL